MPSVHRISIVDVLLLLSPREEEEEDEEGKEEEEEEGKVEEGGGRLAAALFTERSFSTSLCLAASTLFCTSFSSRALLSQSSCTTERATERAAKYILQQSTIVSYACRRGGDSTCVAFGCDEK